MSEVSAACCGFSRPLAASFGGSAFPCNTRVCCYAHCAMNIHVNFQCLLCIGYFCQKFVSSLSLFRELHHIVFQLISHCSYRFVDIREVGKSGLFESLQDEIGAFEALVISVDEGLVSCVEGLASLEIIGQLA